ncbi:hypothetical protein CVT24_012429, partial [Panaeolus cyanescens]
TYTRTGPSPIPSLPPTITSPPWHLHLSTIPPLPIPHPHCEGHTELPHACEERERVSRILRVQYFIGRGGDEEVAGEESGSGSGLELELSLSPEDIEFSKTPLFKHLKQGLALTIGSAIGENAPEVEECLRAYLVGNRVGLTVGARAWSKHAHRSMPLPVVVDSDEEKEKEEERDEEGKEKKPKKKKKKPKKQEVSGWWGTPKGPLSTINERALGVFWKIMNGGVWRNLHWLPRGVLVYEVRVGEGYGMRWAREGIDEGKSQGGDKGEGEDRKKNKEWTFRGFVEPMMENGHELGWRHPLDVKDLKIED